MIRAKKLTRKFKEILAVDQVSFEVEQGEIFGFLGHNGAGKTTTIRMLTGQLLPTDGHATVAGFDVVKDRDSIMPIIGVVFEYQNIYDRMSGFENLKFFAQLHGSNSNRVKEVLEQVGLASRSRDKIKTYSNGMKQRLLIARALLNNPRVLFLDEPTRGLDPTAARAIRRTIRQLAQEGATIFLTTHYMEEADQLCHRVAFISEGRIIAMDSPQELKLRHGQREAKVLLDDGETRLISMDDAGDQELLAQWMRAGRMHTIHSQEATLEDVFIQLAGRELE